MFGPEPGQEFMHHQLDEALKLLLQKGADPSITNDEGFEAGKGIEGTKVPLKVDATSGAVAAE